MNIPNLISLLRIILTPILIICLIQGFYLKAFIVFIVASLTDALDGFLARFLKQKTVLGSYLDPLADKALIASSFVTLSIMAALPAWLTVLVISRDLVILTGICILSQISIQFDVKPALVSKVTTAFQFLTVLVAMASLASPIHFSSNLMSVVYWITAILTVVSGFTYIVRGIKILNRDSESK